MDILAYGLSVTVIGMVIVFVGLFFLIYCISLIKRLGGLETIRKKRQLADSVPVDVTAAVPTEEPAAQEEDGALIAVLSAAIAAVWETQQGFVVRRVRRVHTSPAWEKAGREEQVYSRI